MRLQRLMTRDGSCKYEGLRKTGALVPIANTGIGEENEHFVIMLKDRHAAAALQAYANDVRADDPQFADDIETMVARAGPNSPWCKDPD